MAERAGFEPAVGRPTIDFESTAFVHSATSPQFIFWPEPDEKKNAVPPQLRPLEHQK